MESVRVGGVGSGAKSVFVVPVELVERRVFELKRRLALLAYRSRDPRVVDVAARLLVSLTELLEGLDEGADPTGVLGLLSVLEAQAVSLLSRPDVVARDM